MRKTKKKLSSEKGETILETLVALLIIVLSVSFLSASIAKSASIANDIRKTTEVGFEYSSKSPDDFTISFGGSPIDAQSYKAYKVQWFEGAGDYYYYYEP